MFLVCPTSTYRAKPLQLGHYGHLQLPTTIILCSFLPTPTGMFTWLPVLILEHLLQKLQAFSYKHRSYNSVTCTATHACLATWRVQQTKRHAPAFSSTHVLPLVSAGQTTNCFLSVKNILYTLSLPFCLDNTTANTKLDAASHEPIEWMSGLQHCSTKVSIL